MLQIVLLNQFATTSQLDFQEIKITAVDANNAISQDKSQILLTQDVFSDQSQLALASREQLIKVMDVLIAN